MPDSHQLILLRHAKSDWHSDVGDARSDFDRPLSARGRRDAPRMGKWLADNGYAPDGVVASPAKRAKQTVELACAEMGFDAAGIIYEDELYHATVAHIQAAAVALLADYRRLLLVGHNPGLEYALRDYCPAAAAFDDGKLMPTCAAAVIEFPGGEARPRLLSHMRPALL